MSDAATAYILRQAQEIRRAIVLLHSLEILEQKPAESLHEAAGELRHVADILDTAADKAPKPIKENA